ncbi:VG15 protein [Frigoribacterium faeni]|uniref:Uncharacterized protein n=1 Tax=Frigoribacterium faeni TaxID=145483 RepID=A0A7W3JH26_9MICO|nr:hypothetical protein [Frigoribacterium faeni]MBA8812674.1 hypothetical protein [Frigoribacterium faeni]BFF13785.1 hypothetical protein GCM10025699_50880 [Microbacterium flavescens]GEK82312.1 hypothetical protein FFA01_06210 [Frigoribacterium faeni]
MATATLEQLTAAHQQTTAQIRDRTLALTAARWDASPAYRDADIDRLIAQIMPQVQAGQIATATLTNAYIGQAAALTGTPWGATVDRDAILGYRGVDSRDVYRRSAVTLYTALSNGSAFDAAVAYGLDRMVSIVSTELQQAKNRQAQRSLEDSGFYGYRRVITGLENCALCVIASTQRYHKSELMPIHPGCDCGVQPIRGPKDPGQVIDPDLLERTHALIDRKLGGTDRGARDLVLDKTSSAGKPISDFTDLIVVNNHGELGPTLAWRSDKFTSAPDIAALN